MNVFETLARGFIDFFGITHPSATQQRVATFFIVGLLLGGLALIVAFFFLAIHFIYRG